MWRSNGVRLFSYPRNFVNNMPQTRINNTILFLPTNMCENAETIFCQKYLRCCCFFVYWTCLIWLLFLVTFVLIYCCLLYELISTRLLYHCQPGNTSKLCNVIPESSVDACLEADWLMPSQSRTKSQCAMKGGSINVSLGKRCKYGWLRILRESRSLVVSYVTDDVQRCPTYTEWKSRHR
jgi:hypothetical protein